MSNLLTDPLLYIEPSEFTTELDIPIDISDIITVCKEFSRLGYQIQKQTEDLTELGVEEAISSGRVKLESLPHIKEFLIGISKNIYFGDAAAQAEAVVALIEIFEMKNPQLFNREGN